MDNYENILEINNLCKEYKDFSLKNINITLPKGYILGLVGENGQGKTTTIKAILDIITYSGEIKIFGKTLKGNDYIKEDIGVVLDNCSFHRSFTIKDIEKILTLSYKNFDKAIYDKLVNQFKLPQDKMIKDYSKGMIVKLNILAALSHKPKLLIMDEPTSGLDPVIRDEILDLLLEFIQDEDCGVIISSHITSDLEKICDYIAFIKNGELVLMKDKDSILYDYVIAKGSKEQIDLIPKEIIFAYRKTPHCIEAIVKDKALLKSHENLVLDKVSIDDILVFLSKGETI